MNKKTKELLKEMRDLSLKHSIIVENLEMRYIIGNVYKQSIRRTYRNLNNNNNMETFIK